MIAKEQGHGQLCMPSHADGHDTFVILVHVAVPDAEHTNICLLGLKRH